MNPSGWVTWPVWKKVVMVGGLVAVCIGMYFAGGRAGPSDTVRRDVRRADPSVQWTDIEVHSAGGILNADGTAGYRLNLMCGDLASRPGDRLAAVVLVGRRRRNHVQELALSWGRELTGRQRWLLAECASRQN